MSFILLGKYADNTVVLLSSEVYGSRKEAADALSGLTSDPSFDHWDSEVLVADIDNATPVLLVRPSSTSAQAPVSADMQDESPETFQYAGSDAGGTDEGTESVVVEDDSAVQDADEAPAASDVDLSAALTELGLSDEGAAPEGEDGEGASLRDAIARTTAQMTASGIVPPESVGPGEAGDEAEAPAEEALAEEAPAEEAPAEEAPGTQDEPSGDDEVEVAEDAESGDEPKSWPWASGSEESGEGFSLSALEEPGIDEGSLVKASGDDETMDAARPVIMGDYDVPAEPMSVAEAEAVAQEHESTSDELAEVLAAAVAEAGISDPEEGDPVASEEAAEAPAGDQLSCEDCVYFQTCPNKEDRDPASCGSFQWK